MQRVSTNLLLPLALLLCVGVSLAQRQPNLPKAGVIPNETTAVAVAQVLFRPVFGDEEVKKFVPYHAVLKGEVWEVYGTLKSGSRGGTPQLRINKRNGQVLDIWHSL